jgi:signal transduction histidine kinase
VLRLRRLAVGCALGCALATAALVLVASLNFAYRAPALHVALETTAAIAASAAAFLLLGRFWRTGFLDELILSAGLSLLAVWNFAFATLPAVLDLQSSRASLWSMLVTALVAALLICVAALLPRRRLAGGRRWPLIVYGGALALAVAGSLPMVVSPSLVPHGVVLSVSTSDAQPSLAGGLQLGLALLYILAALGFARRNRLTDDELSGWLAIACILSGASHINYVFHPAELSNWVYTGDVFRLGFYLALLVGAAREIASYWTSVIAAASLEERRRLARDVHDGLAQEISFIGRNVRLLREQGAEPQLVERILRGVARAQEESRRFVGALAASGNDPLEKALADGIILSPREREAVLRIASEAVTNAARHSGAETLRVYLARLDAGLRIDSRRGAGTKVELEL